MFKFLGLVVISTAKIIGSQFFVDSPALIQQQHTFTITMLQSQGRNSTTLATKQMKFPLPENYYMKKSYSEVQASTLERQYGLPLAKKNGWVNRDLSLSVFIWNNCIGAE